MIMTDLKNNLANFPHRRLNILTGEWTLVSPHRVKRPWQGKVETAAIEDKPKYNPDCYLCPGNERAGGKRNPVYDNTFVFDNDFSALLPEQPEFKLNQNNLLLAESEKGMCKVICFSPRHDLTLAEMDVKEIVNVIEVWTSEYEILGSEEFINYVQVFENKGEIMGCSNPHPHGQIWAQQTIPVEPAKEIIQMKKYFNEKKTCLLCDYLKIEIEEKERIVYGNDDFIVLVPFWAVWPFETMILSKRHLGSLRDMNPQEKNSFADAISKITIKYDNLFNVSFPYSSGIHQKPTDGKRYEELHFHMHFYPPLLRSAAIKKFMVGYEMMANPQRDITAELSATKLRELSVVNYKIR
ncbi:MAG: UDP-glucose--hexose-1-phosphate uridylyltransferase [Ignavibacteriales bacterium]|nr:UDP-glucose--hexose-1-phosphate uridylyltransferase [Ignavibacteriales bacterium]